MKRLTHIWAAFTAMSFFALASCGGNETPAEEKVETKIELSVKDTLFVTVGEKAPIHAIVNKPEVVKDIIWVLPDDDIASFTKTTAPSDADPSLTSAILVSGKAIGKALLIASVDSHDASCIVKVVGKGVTSVTLDKSQVDLKVGETDHLEVTIAPSDAADQTVRWSSDNESVVTVAGAVVTAVGKGTATVTATCGKCSATCVYTVSEIEAESITMDMENVSLTEDETTLVNLEILPENVTAKDVEWTSSDPSVATVDFLDANPADNIVSGRITAVSAGDAVITATLGNLSAAVSVKVLSKDAPMADPQIGDYYYSDGTWSTGYPEKPIEGKTVIGLVFQTDPNRLNETDKKDGYTHGYVVCTQLVYNPLKPEDKTVMYSVSDSFDVMSGSSLPYVWYKNVDGRNESNLILEYGYRTQGNYFNFPAFDFAMTDFRVGAPIGTSGWFIPSTGQVWDMLANLCGDEVRMFLKNEQTSEVPVTYFYEYEDHLTYDPIAKFNEKMSLVPDVMKEDFYANNYAENILASSTEEYPYYDRCLCDILTSTVCQYYEGEETIACFRIGKYIRKNKFKKVQKEEGTVRLEYDWANYSYVCRPILAF